MTASIIIAMLAFPSSCDLSHVQSYISTSAQKHLVLLHSMIGLRPLGLREFWTHRSTGRWVDRDERSLLPLEQVRLRCAILPRVVELHWTLHAVECNARMQLLNERCVVNAVDFIDCLFQNLSHGICLRYIRAERIGCATVRPTL